MRVKSCPLIAYGETTPELSSQSQNKIQPQNSSGVGTPTPECSGVRGYTARPWTCRILNNDEAFTAITKMFGGHLQVGIVQTVQRVTQCL